MAKTKEPKKEEKVCPVCHSVVERMRERATWTEYGCPGCHLVWIDPTRSTPDTQMRKR